MSEQAEPQFVKSNTAARTIRDWVIVIVVALVIALLVRMFVLQQFYISGPSMQSTLQQDNRVLVNKLSYRLHGIGRGDVVVFDRVTSNGQTVQHDDLIKRVIGLSGDVVEIKDCVVLVNHEIIDEPYLNSDDLAQSSLDDRCRVPTLAPQTVPAHKIFVMGDNRPQSFDSRMFGPINEDLVVGRAFVVLWPLSAIKWL
ncbi:MAG: signal peptidase I [Ilumatobacteraceae bacterium]